MQIKGLLSKLAIPLSLMVFSSGCYTVINRIPEKTNRGEIQKIETEYGLGSYCTEHFYEEPGYIRLYNMEIYGIFGNSSRHYGIHRKPIWNKRPKEWANFNKSFERSRSQIHLRNNNSMRNERTRPPRRNPKQRNNKRRNSGRR